MRPQLCLVILLLLVLVGCSEPDGPPAGAEPSGQLRLVSLAPHITEIIYAAGAGDLLVGTVEYSDYPAAALEVPRIGDAFRVDYEALALLNPDIVFGWRDGNPVEMLARLRELDYPLVELGTARLGEIPDNLERVGELTGHRETAGAAAELLRERLRALAERAAAADSLSVFWQVSANPYYTLGGSHVVSEVLELCGGQNVFADLPGMAPVVTLEAILAVRPEVIIAAVPPDDVAWRTDWLRWEELPAVQNSNLFAVHPDLVSRSGPRLIDGAEETCRLLDEARVAP